MTDQLLIAITVLCFTIGSMFVLKHRWLLMIALWLIPVVKGRLTNLVPIFRVVDLTLLVVGLMVVFCLIDNRFLRRLKNKHTRRCLLFNLILAALMIVSLLWTEAPEYGFQKAFKFTTFSIVSFIAPLVLLKTKEDVVRFLYGLVFTSIFVGLIVILAPDAQAGSYRASAFASSPLNPAFVMAVGASICFLLPQKLVLVNRFLFSGVFLFLQYGIYVTSSRSMFVQAILALAVWAFLTKSDQKWLFRAIVIIAVIGIPLYVITDSNSSSRMVDSLSDPVEILQSSARFGMWEFCVKQAPERPFVGHGSGSFATLYFGRDSRLFPHNMFLEALFEFGIVGLVLLVSVFWTIGGAYYESILKSQRTKNKSLSDLATLLFSAIVAATLSLSLHWDISDNRLLWNMLGVLLVVLILKKAEVSNPYA